MNNQNNNNNRPPVDNQKGGINAGVNASLNINGKSIGGYALASMILGISGLAFPGFGLVLGIIAIILGVQFKKANPNSPNTTKAKIGIITGSIAAGLQTLVIIFFLAFSGLTLFGFSKVFDQVKNTQQDATDFIKSTQDIMKDQIDATKASTENSSVNKSSSTDTVIDTTAQCDAAKLALSTVQITIDNAQISYDRISSMPNITSQMLSTYESAISDAQAALPAAQASVDSYCK